MCHMHVRRFKCGAHQPYKIIICRIPAEEGEGETGRMCRFYAFVIDQHLDEHCERCTREGLDRTRQEGLFAKRFSHNQKISKHVMKRLVRQPTTQT